MALRETYPLFVANEARDNRTTNSWPACAIAQRWRRPAPTSWSTRCSPRLASCSLARPAAAPDKAPQVLHTNQRQLFFMPGVPLRLLPGQVFVLRHQLAPSSLLLWLVADTFSCIDAPCVTLGKGVPDL